jgi:hypothetical protein
MLCTSTTGGEAVSVIRGVAGGRQRSTRLVGIRFARFRLMDSKDHNPSANVPAQSDEDPKGDRGRGDKTWAPPADEQGISNRPGDASQSIEGGTFHPRRDRDDVIEDDIESEENRNAEKDVQQAPEGRTPRRGSTRE